MRLTVPEHLKRLGTIMCVWAHPDDESFLAAGLLQTAVANEQKVIVVTATKGEAGVQDPARWPDHTLGRKRAAELRQALKILQIRNHHWLGFLDGQCASISQDLAVNKITSLIKRYDPDTFITFGPDGLTGHPDHVAVSAWTRMAADKVAPDAAIYHAVVDAMSYRRYLQTAHKSLNIFFNTKTPPVLPASACDIHLKLTAEQIVCKCAALKAMESQTTALFATFNDDFIKGAWGVESFVRAR